MTSAGDQPCSKRAIEPRQNALDISDAMLLRNCTRLEFAQLGIPAKLNAHSGRNPNGIPGCTRTPSEHTDAGISIVQEVFGFVKRNLSGAKRRKSAASGERGAGKGGRPCPASAHRSPERRKRSELRQLLFRNSVSWRYRRQSLLLRL